MTEQKYQLRVDHIDKMHSVKDALLNVADNDDDQQIIIEVLMVWFCSRAGDVISACNYADSMARHAKQMITGNKHMIADGKGKIK